MRLKSILSNDGNEYPVFDAKKPLSIKVTADDIKRADTKEPGNCAMARACKRDLHVEEARVHLTRVYIKPYGAKQWTRYATPPDLRAEIIAFDRGGKFLPGEFKLKHIKPSDRLGARKDKRKRGNTGKTKARGYTHMRDVRGAPAA